MSTINTCQAVAAMQKYGGNGIKKLAACWLALDGEKRARLEAAFKPEFSHYRTMVDVEGEYRAPQTLADLAALDVAAGDARN
ncbi:hypothetical protein AADG64_09560 [Achromobacter xylosoxidans]|jgi:hypothetical protein|uniref:hypothetical protein n=1 Tax=Alcaligenes xylosoxydans xylosoxydans TaxID=85698 RepID=UPI0006C2F2FB|nr:hypothetical protein [Achromobacter xylosoxidans]WPQ34345.1 hypothetical protein SLH34_27645 [Achromobacter xylosoxidans]CUI52974.1 Uncharacterised protein [Achromobacter xylosoxidans]